MHYLLDDPDLVPDSATYLSSPQGSEWLCIPPKLHSNGYLRLHSLNTEYLLFCPTM
jgi:hypothetical protein